jgi:hypothetical protein
MYSTYNCTSAYTDGRDRESLHKEFVYRGGEFKLSMEAQLSTSVNLSQLTPHPALKWAFYTESTQPHQLTADPSLS